MDNSTQDRELFALNGGLIALVIPEDRKVFALNTDVDLAVDNA